MTKPKHSRRIKKRRFVRRKNGRMTVFPAGHPSTIISRTSQTTDREFVRLRYSEPMYEYGAISVWSSANVEYYAANSIFDPYLGVGGGQPSGFARMFSMYEYCRVWASRIKVTVVRLDHPNDIPFDVVVVPLTWASHASPPVALSTFNEQPYAKKKTVLSASSLQARVITSKVKNPKLCGLSPAGYLDPSFYHASTVNAPFTNVWAIAMGRQSVGVSGDITVGLGVDIIYDCEFFGRKSMPISLAYDVYAEAEKRGILKELIAGLTSRKEERKIRKKPEALAEPEADVELVESKDELVSDKKPKLIHKPSDTGVRSSSRTSSTKK